MVRHQSKGKSPKRKVFIKRIRNKLVRGVILAAKKSKKHTLVKKKIKIKARPSKAKISVKKVKVKEKKLTKKELAKIMAQEQLELELKLQIEREKLETEALNKVLTSAYARQIIVELAGENALAIVRNFKGKPSDEDIANNLKLKISDVRATLNKLHSEGLVKYIREKDSETGWYSYNWILNRQRIAEWVNLRMSEKAPVLAGDNREFYYCPDCGADEVVDFESATSTSFRCQKCTKSLEFLEPEKVQEVFNKR